MKVDKTGKRTMTHFKMRLREFTDHEIDIEAATEAEAYEKGVVAYLEANGAYMVDADYEVNSLVRTDGREASKEVEKIRVIRIPVQGPEGSQKYDYVLARMT